MNMEVLFSGRAASGILLLATTMVITACGGPMDSKLVTGKGMGDYQESLASVKEQASEFEREAFTWAVSDFDLERLHREYPGSTARNIVRAEVRKVRETFPERIAALEAVVKSQKPVREDLKKISATDTMFFIDKDFFGQQPKVKASIVNGSSLPVSSLDWNASLYIDDAAEPVATTVLSNDYRRDGGLKPGDRYTVSFKVGFVKGDERWTTLEIRNAKSTRIVLESIPGSIKDFGDRLYLPTDASAHIQSLQGALDAAEKYAEI